MRLLDLFCGAGGAATGYHRAGFDEIVGIDIVPQKNYPFTFIQGDALKPPVRLEDFDLIHASPPCQAYSFATIQHRHNDYPDLVAPTQEMLYASGRPFIIENVPGAPLGYSITLCGSTMGLDRIKRHRHFELSWPMMSPGCNHGILREPLSVIGHNEPGRTYRQRKLPKNLEARKEAMGIDWMSRDELSEAIPPAYTEYLGRQFLDQLART